LVWIASEAANLWIVQNRGSRFAHVGSIITTSTKMRIPFLVNTMSICWWKESNVVDESACNCYSPTWKLTSCAMATKVSHIPSWVPLCSLPWTQLKKWIPIGSMGCVHTHWGRPSIEGCGSWNCVQNDVEKIGEDNWKVRKIGWTISQTPTQG